MIDPEAEHYFYLMMRNLETAQTAIDSAKEFGELLRNKLAPADVIDMPPFVQGNRRLRKGTAATPDGGAAAAGTTAAEPMKQLEGVASTRTRTSKRRPEKKISLPGTYANVIKQFADDHPALSFGVRDVTEWAKNKNLPHEKRSLEGSINYLANKGKVITRVSPGMFRKAK